MYSFLKKFNNGTAKVAEYIVSFSFGSMTLLIFLQVIFRYVLKQSLSWSEELATFLFIWLTFIGAGIAIKERTHINVQALLIGIKSEKIEKAIVVFAHLLSIIFLVIVSFYGVQIASQLLALGKVSAAMPFLKIGLVYFAIPLGSLLMILYSIEIIWGILRNEVPAKGGHN